MIVSSRRWWQPSPAVVITDASTSTGTSLSVNIVAVVPIPKLFFCRRFCGNRLCPARLSRRPKLSVLSLALQQPPCWSSAAASPASCMPMRGRWRQRRYRHATAHGSEAWGKKTREKANALIANTVHAKTFVRCNVAVTRYAAGLVSAPREWSSGASVPSVRWPPAGEWRYDNV